MYLEFLLRRAHSRRRVERMYWSGVSLYSFTTCSKEVMVGTTGPMGSGLPQLGLPRRFAMDSFPRCSGGYSPQHFILSLLTRTIPADLGGDGGPLLGSERMAGELFKREARQLFRFNTPSHVPALYCRYTHSEGFIPSSVD